MEVSHQPSRQHVSITSDQQSPSTAKPLITKPTNVGNITASQMCECSANAPPIANTTCAPTNVVTIPVPIVQNEETYAYITVKGSLYDATSAIFGLDELEVQALSKRFENVKPAVNGIVISAAPIVTVNTLAELGYKVICTCGEAEICWTMQREI